MKEYCFVTRDSGSSFVEVWPATVGIRKFHLFFADCVQFQWGAAWSRNYVTGYLFRTRHRTAEVFDEQDCRKRFGFYPRSGTAWFVSGKKRTKVDIDFSP